MWGASLTRSPVPPWRLQVPRRAPLRIDGLQFLPALAGRSRGSRASDVRSLVHPGLPGWMGWIASAWLREKPRRAAGSPASEQASDNCRGDPVWCCPEESCALRDWPAPPPAVERQPSSAFGREERKPRPAKAASHLVSWCLSRKRTWSQRSFGPSGSRPRAPVRPGRGWTVRYKAMSSGQVVASSHLQS